MFDQDWTLDLTLVNWSDVRNMKWLSLFEYFIICVVLINISIDSNSVTTAKIQNDCIGLNLRLTLDNWSDLKSMKWVSQCEYFTIFPIDSTTALWAVDLARWLLGYMGENFYLFDMAETM